MKKLYTILVLLIASAILVGCVREERHVRNSHHRAKHVKQVRNTKKKAETVYILPDGRCAFYDDGFWYYYMMSSNTSGYSYYYNSTSSTTTSTSTSTSLPTGGVWMSSQSVPAGVTAPTSTAGQQMEFDLGQVQSTAPKVEVQVPVNENNQVESPNEQQMEFNFEQQNSDQNSESNESESSSDTDSGSSDSSDGGSSDSGGSDAGGGDSGGGDSDVGGGGGGD